MRGGAIRFVRQSRGWDSTAICDGVSVESSGPTLMRVRLDAVGTLAERLNTYRGQIVLAEEVVLPASASKALDRARRARRQAEAAAVASTDATAVAVRQLTASGLSMRDIAYLFGLSHSRVQQILNEQEPRK